MYLFCARLNTSFTSPETPNGPTLSASGPSVSSCDHVKLYVKSRPCENRLVTFACSELYHVSPTGAQRPPSPELNCGNGRRDCATVEVAGKPAYGSLFWKRPAAVEFSGALRIVRSAALLISRP